MENSAPSALNKFIVPVTIMLSFVSFWRAAAIVLSDLGSSAYYVGGIAEKAIGKAAPWFIFAIMLFSYAVRAVYIESCSMFVRGGVYRVVREAMGSTAAKFSVSALMFDYVLTGPISAMSAGLYLGGSLRGCMCPPCFLRSHSLSSLHFTFGTPIVLVFRSPAAGRCALCKSPP